MNTVSKIRNSYLGATRLPDGDWQFLVWAPNTLKLDLHLLGAREYVLPLERDDFGYFSTRVDKIETNALYFYRFADGRERPDPASRFQPQGVHGPSQVVNFRDFQWTDAAWKGRAFEKSIFYELHVGTYTPEGSFKALIPHLESLVELGVTTIELMPIGQFPGSRNWGYDGVHPFAPQNTYGGPQGLQRLVDAAHGRGLAVALDVVYNHLGPEGNYFHEYGPYFTDRYKTPWGKAINFDDADSDHVRRFFIENAIYWLEEYHLDALRLDAIHSIFDFSASHFLADLQDSVHSLEERIGRQIHLIAESDLNDSRILRPPSQGGYGLQAQWSDDFHHSLHCLLTEERAGYYSDFGDVHHLVETLKNGWYYAGQYSSFRRRRHGNSTQGLERSQFVVCNQNHDQVGNRAKGDRLSQLISFEGLKLAAGATLFSPFIPLLFMGEEYGESAPFQYFTSHGDHRLIQAVRRGRRQEFLAFGWKGELPDPQAEATFTRSKLNHHLKEQQPHRTMQRFYKEILDIRKEYLASGPIELQVSEGQNLITVLIYDPKARKSLAIVLHFGEEPCTQDVLLPEGNWRTRIDSADSKWLGPGNAALLELGSRNINQIKLQPQSLIVLERRNPRLE
ncbi:MAG TPA: malto-oligosyltrehalose trehalohydrolase [Candidatus Dormibacteraeota bacterium]|nr:malto-oligosyltrehalose trehalohydrolase [Candidatus Dormibacteraeota bacterium]